MGNYKILLLILFLITGILFACTGDDGDGISPIEDQQETEYELVFEDEFEGDFPNPDNWGFENGFVRNKELQWYRKENAYCENGLLIIEGRREDIPNPNYDPNGTDWKTSREFAHYTSSSLMTRGLHSWKYGRFEIKAKIDVRRGMWPAIWTLGIEGEWPSNGEIDIMEYYSDYILANFAWGTDQRWVPKWDGFKKHISSFPADWANEFHVWRMDWTEDKIELFLDDELLNTVRLSKTINPASEIENPFKQPHYLLLNLAIGSNGGDPSGTTFPARFEVDYVRIYREKRE
ncbi:MAG: glycoside hydrolase family 16 protein [Cytophagales bacterium]|nr:glycoside hydrolase family 16 protein [Cytophagales bacterium]